MVVRCRDWRLFGGGVSILSTVMSVGKTALGFLNPAGSALKLAPWGIAAALALGCYVEHERLVAADANIQTAREQTAQAVQKCQTETAAQVAAASAQAAAQVQKAQAAANAAEAQLVAARSAASVQAAETQQALGVELGTITAQSTQSGQDGPVPPVLGDMFP